MLTKRKSAKRPVKTCIRPKCGEPAYCRGLCISDYSVAAQQVHRKKTTWEKLFKAKRIMAKRKPGRQPVVRNYILGIK